MNIAYVAADHGIPVFGTKGASVHIQELIRAFVSLGHQVEVTAARVGAPSSALPARVSKVPAPSLDSLLPPNIPGDRDRLTKEKRYLAIGRAVQDHLERTYADTQPDIIYERYSLWSAAGVRAARNLGIPCVVEFNSPLLVEQQIYRQLESAEEAEQVEAEVLTQAALVVAVSKETRSYAVTKGANPSTTMVIPNGVDMARFDAALAPEVVPGVGDDFVVGFTGSLKPWHGMEQLLDAFRSLWERHRKMHLLIVGDGPLRGWIEGYSRGAQLDGHVTITGWVDHARLPAILQRMDTAVAPYPHLDNFYFSPLKLFEYMAMGKPIVASAIGQVREVVEDGRSGILAKPGDVKDLADKLESLYVNEPLRKALGNRALRRAHAFSWQGNAKRIVELADSLRRAAC